MQSAFVEQLKRFFSKPSGSQVHAASATIATAVISRGHTLLESIATTLEPKKTPGRNRVLQTCSDFGYYSQFGMFDNATSQNSALKLPVTLSFWVPTVMSKVPTAEPLASGLNAVTLTVPL